MKSLKSILGGLASALITGLIALGALTLSITEGNMWLPAPTEAGPEVTTAAPGETLAIETLSANPTQAGETQILPTPTLPLTAPTTMPGCLPPQGWVQHYIQPGETLADLASQYQITQDTLRSANCLFTDALLPNTFIYLPPGQIILPTATATTIPCGPPRGWIQITLSAGSTLYSLSRDYNVSVYELQLANCMGYSTQLYAGAKFWVPNVPTRTPTATEVPLPTHTPPPPTVTLTPTVPSVYGVSLTPAADAQSGDPGTNVSYVLVLTNTGNVSDTYTVSTSGASWTSVAAPSTVGPLAAGAMQNITVTVSIPAGAAGGSTDTVTVTAVSQASGAASDSAALTTTANTLAIYGVSLSPAVDSASGSPGAEVLYTLTVTNTGNTSDYFDLNVSGAAWTTTIAPMTVGPLGAGASEEITVSVSIPDDASNGTTDTATVTAVSQGDTTATATANLTTTASIKAGLGLPIQWAETGTFPATTASHNTDSRQAL
ncbi:MAG TPA: LysM peptidoglycan-binding domain-containing protein [Anaerolineaceae bacterium]|nr:LysM peptidoglycan-binding domain-containing protein [Anaerolineaceae bacterium]